LYCKLPSKRLIAYYKPELNTVKVPWGTKKNSISYMSMNSVTRKWERTKTYGGKIVENITQGTARDIMAEAMLRVEDAGYKVILTVHDELITENENGNKDEFSSIMCINPDWCTDLPTSVGGWTGSRYIK
jgi:DNA polymerase